MLVRATRRDASGNAALVASLFVVRDDRRPQVVLLLRARTRVSIRTFDRVYIGEINEERDCHLIRRRPKPIRIATKGTMNVCTFVSTPSVNTRLAAQGAAQRAARRVAQSATSKRTVIHDICKRRMSPAVAGVDAIERGRAMIRMQQ